MSKDADRIWRMFKRLENNVYPYPERQWAALELKDEVLGNPNALLELVFSDKPDERQLHTLIHLGGHGGSVAREYNLHWIPFLNKVYQRRSEMPEGIKQYLEWLKQVHGYELEDAEVSS